MKSLPLRVALATVVFGLAFWPTFKDLIHHWTRFDESQSHGLIIVALFFYLFTQKLKELPSPPTKLNWAGFLLLAFASTAWFISATLSIETIEEILILPLIFLFCWSLLGFGQAKTLIPTLSVLIFAIPIWDYFSPLLVDLSGFVVGHAIRLTGITALIDGNSILLPYGRIDIADGCSGVRYLTIAVALAAYLSLTTGRALKQKFFLFLISIALGLATNWLRIYIIIMVAHFSKMQAELVRNHEAFGWVLFFIVCIPLVYFARTLPEKEEAESSDHTAPNLKKSALAISFIALAIGPGLYAANNASFPSPSLGNWTTMGYQRTAESPNELPYVLPPSNIHLFKRTPSTTTEIAINWRQGESDDLVPYVTYHLNRDKWTIFKQSTLKMPDGSNVSLTQFERKLAEGYACTVAWYRVGKVRTTNYYVAKLLQIPAMLMQQNIFTAATVTTFSQQTNCDQSRQLLTDLAAQTRQDIEQLTQEKN